MVPRDLTGSPARSPCRAAGPISSTFSQASTFLGISPADAVSWREARWFLKHEEATWHEQPQPRGPFPSSTIWRGRRELLPIQPYKTKAEWKAMSPFLKRHSLEERKRRMVEILGVGSEQAVDRLIEEESREDFSLKIFKPEVHRRHTSADQLRMAP